MPFHRDIVAAVIPLLIVGIVSGCSSADSPSDERSTPLDSGAPDGGLADSANQTDVDQQEDATEGDGDASRVEMCDEAPTALFDASAASADRSIDSAAEGELTTGPMPAVELNAAPSTAREGHQIDRVEWEVLERAEPSLPAFGTPPRLGEREPAYRSSQQSAPTVHLTLVGDYEIGLKVWNEEGTVSCNTARLTVRVRPQHDIYVDFRQPWMRRSDHEEPVYTFATSLSFRVKRTVGASWDSTDNIVPDKYGGVTKDWGESGEGPYDPEAGAVGGATQSNLYVGIDELEDSTSYVAGLWSGSVLSPVPVTARVFVDGQLSETVQVELEHPDPFVYEFFEIQKQADGYDIEVLEEYHEG